MESHKLGTGYTTLTPNEALQQDVSRLRRDNVQMRKALRLVILRLNNNVWLKSVKQPNDRYRGQLYTELKDTAVRALNKSIEND